MRTVRTCMDCAAIALATTSFLLLTLLAVVAMFTLVRKMNSVLVNRTSELATIFAINTNNNYLARHGERDLRLFAAPLCTQIYGAGKTACAKNYARKIAETSTEDLLDAMLRKVCGCFALAALTNQRAAGLP